MFKRQYSEIDSANSLNELISHDGVFFVICIYKTILGRIPDYDGLVFYLNRLQQGVEKIEIIRQVYFSKEARSRSASLPGLTTAIVKRRLSRFLPFIFPFRKEYSENFEKLSENKSWKAVVLNFTGDRANWGCQATSWELIKYIYEVFGSQVAMPLEVVPLFPRGQIDFELNQKYGVAVESVLAKLQPTDDEIRLLLDVADQRYAHYLDKIINSDVVFFQAEGTLTGSDMVHGWRLLLLPYIAKKIFGKIVISLNQTFFWKNTVVDDFVLNVFRSFDLVAVREVASLAYLRSIGFSNAYLIPDAAFLTRAVLAGDGLPSLDTNKRYFGVTGSAALQYFSIDTMLEIVENVKKRFGLTPLFICSAGMDLDLARQAQTRWGENVITVVPNVSYRAVAAIIQKCDFLLGGRYHMAILAATVRTPIVLLPSNTHKNEGLLALLNYPLLVRHIDDYAGIIEDVETVLKSPEVFKALLDDGVRNIFKWLEAGKELLRDTLKLSNVSESSCTELQFNKYIYSMIVDAYSFNYYKKIISKQAEGYSYPDTQDTIFPPSPPLFSIIFPLIVNLRRGVEAEASMILFRQAVEVYIEEVCKQFDTRWLVSICDTFAEFGEPVERRNAFMVSMLAIFEKVSQTYAYWRLGYPQSLAPATPLEHRKIPLWDGMDSFHLVHGDVTINMFRRLENLLSETPSIEKIYRRVRDGIKDGETILGVLNKQHKHVFETDYSWVLGDDYLTLRESGEIPLIKYQHFIENSK
ncbi:protein of unknown function [Trichlorobacter thiogenes]|uniref:Polysaccharide pyruvyl transferase domain-containing protein n=1 Tax=Trichlorobacter thiogenes TaxID=115783 RepID=A0A1T4PDI5_9BACT|nr:polysaccharide pyruvyl transferase family protein [Trichlorobacter thiogenes]SJZ89397.1 protein of unknown function [Trichlorobacter thiogenes]